MENQERQLLRALGRWDLLGLALNGIIGAGIFGLPALAAELMGAASPLAFGACGVIAGLIVACFAEAASRFDATGGPYLYARTAFGSFIGFEVGWAVWLARVTAFSANTVLMVSYAGYFWQPLTREVSRALLITLVMGLLAAVNVRGVRHGAGTGDVLLIAKLLPLTLFAIAGLFFVDWGIFRRAPVPSLDHLGESSLLLLYAFTGFEYGAIPAGEAADPKRDMPRALTTAVAVAAVLYILIQVVTVGTLPRLSGSSTPLAEASARFLGFGGGALIAATAILSVSGNLVAIMLATPRLTFAFAERGELPGFFARVHPRFRTPHWSIVSFAVVTWAMALSGTFVWLVTLSVVARSVTYIATCLAVLVLRRRGDVPPAGYTLPGGWAIPLIATALSVWLLWYAPRRDLLIGLWALLVGALLFVGCRLWIRGSRGLP